MKRIESECDKDIITTFQHTYTTTFIVDDTPEFDRLPEMSLRDYDRVFWIIDENVADIYQEKLLNKMGLDKEKLFIHLVKSEEYSKSIEYYPQLVGFLAENNAGRYDAVIAVGGGIVIDLVSFTVSTYMRGLPLFIIATTLIGQTDASTAGKTCLNFTTGKNLLGTFYYPKVVYNNIEILSTCAKRITRQGLSEAFKYSLLTDGELLPVIVKYNNNNKPFDRESISKIVHTTIKARIKIRSIDPLASNLGHTFGHALEKYFNYGILHGDAISIGTVMAIHYGVQKGIMTHDECREIFELMQSAGLNIFIPESLNEEKLVNYMRKDKKSSVNKLHLVMLCKIGKPYRENTPFYETDYFDVFNFLKIFIKDYPYKKSNYLNFVRREELF